LPGRSSSQPEVPATTTFTFTAPADPGTYCFRCDVHPEEMKDDLVVQ